MTEDIDVEDVVDLVGWREVDRECDWGVLLEKGEWSNELRLQFVRSESAVGWYCDVLCLE